MWRLIRLHEAKIAAHPDARDRPHWEIELAAFREQLEKHVRRLGRG